MRQVPQYPEERVAGTGERINNDEFVRWHTRSHRCNIVANAIAERVAGTLYGGAAEDADALAVPISRPHSIDADVVAVAKAIQPIPLDFRKAQDFISLRSVQQQSAIINTRKRIVSALIHLSLDFYSIPWNEGGSGFLRYALRALLQR